MKKLFLASLTITSFATYLMGIFLPAFRIRKLYFFKDDVTIVKSIWLLFEHGELFLSGVILIFSILFPLVKYGMLLIAIFHREKEKGARLANAVSALSKWAMLDVYVIALFVMTYKMGGGIIAIKVKTGTLFFTVSVLTSIAASKLFPKLLLEKKRLDSGVK